MRHFVWCTKLCDFNSLILVANAKRSWQKFRSSNLINRLQSEKFPWNRTYIVSNYAYEYGRTVLHCKLTNNNSKRIASPLSSIATYISERKEKYPHKKRLTVIIPISDYLPIWQRSMIWRPKNVNNKWSLYLKVTTCTSDWWDKLGLYAFRPKLVIL